MNGWTLIGIGVAIYLFANNNATTRAINLPLQQQANNGGYVLHDGQYFPIEQVNDFFKTTENATTFQKMLNSDSALQSTLSQIPSVQREITANF